MRSWATAEDGREDIARTPLRITPKTPIQEAPAERALSEIASARTMLTRTADGFLSWPWGAVDELTGGMSGGQVWFVGGFRGKTLFMLNAIDMWARNCVKVYLSPLETKQWTFRLAWAALRAGVDPGLVLDGTLARQEDTTLRPRIDAELVAMSEDVELRENVVLQHDEQFLDLDVFRAGLDEAASVGSDVVIFDHIDHLKPDPKINGHQQSVEIVMEAHKAALERDLLVIFTTQFNVNKVLGPNQLAMYAPPQLHHIYNGDHKRHVATGILGVYRPIRDMKLGENEEEYGATLRRAQQGSIEPWTMLQSETMAVKLMKSRHGGAREGKRATLRLVNGRLSDIPVREFGRVNL